MKTESAYPIASGRSQREPKAKQWRVFIDSCSVQTLKFMSNKSEHFAKNFAADVCSLPLHRVAVLDEEFVASFERRLERRQLRRLLPACCHEAGHAVLAHLGGHVVTLSTIPQMRYSGTDVATELDSMGRMSWETPCAPPWLPDTRSQLERHALVLLAGLTAEFQLRGRTHWKRRAWEGDMLRVGELAARSSDDCGASVIEITEHWKTAATEKVNALWFHIGYVVSVLVEKREIGEEELRRVLRDVPISPKRALICGGRRKT